MAAEPIRFGVVHGFGPFDAEGLVHHKDWWISVFPGLTVALLVIPPPFATDAERLRTWQLLGDPARSTARQ